MPSVVLEHSAYVGTVQCDQEGMTVPFTNAKAYDLVFQTWEKTGGFALVCHKAQCGQDKSGQRVYWQANQVIFNNYTRTALVRAREIELAQALTHVNLTYGVWQPQDYIPTTTTRKRSNGKTVIRAVRRDAPSKTCGDLPDSTISEFLTLSEPYFLLRVVQTRTLGSEKLVRQSFNSQLISVRGTDSKILTGGFPAASCGPNFG